MPKILLRALLTGFGYKIGAELARVFAERVGLKKTEHKKDETDDGLPDGIGVTPAAGDSEDADDGAPRDPEPTTRAAESDLSLN